MVLVGLAAMALIVSACSSPQSDSVVGTKSTTPTPPPPHYNALSGRLGPDGPVLVVKVDDTVAARPQVGIDQADVVYVELVEGGLTRLAAVFSSVVPPVVGPVRSARISDIDLLAQYGKVAFAYSGAQRRMLPVIASANLFDMGAERETSALYQRDHNRFAPVNLMLDAPALLAKTADAVTSKSVGWSFGAAPVGGQAVTSVTVRWPSSRYRATWSASERRWLLAHDGNPDLAASQAILGPTTLVIQQVEIHPSIYGDKFHANTPKSETIGTGTGWILRDGMSYAANWSRASMADGTHWRLADGSEVRFAPGSVWVLLSDRTKTPAFELPPVPSAGATGTGTPTPTASK